MKIILIHIILVPIRCW